MSETTNNSNNGRRQRRRHDHHSQQKSINEDRLSSLPDSLLTNILSFLPIKTAASTSVLSHRWRHHWTTISSFQLDLDLSEHSSHQILSLTLSILSKLNSSKLHLFYLVFPSESNLDNVYSTELCFRELDRRGVDHIIFNAGFRSFFRVPGTCLFNSKALVSLKLIGLIKLEFDTDNDGNVLAPFRLPNLKNLSLCYLLDVPLSFGTLFNGNSCPILEHLELNFDLVSLPQPQIPNPLVNVFCPNLRSLEICMSSWTHLEATQISIDAPKLANIKIRDFNSVYCFVQNPISLVNACVDLRTEVISSIEANDDGEGDYAQRMFEFFGRMSSVVELELFVGKNTNVFGRVHCGIMPIFDNLTRIKTNCFKDLMFCLQYFPNLKHLEVSLWSENYDFPMEKEEWCAPDSVPDCLVSKLKTIEIGGIKGIGDDVELIAYILSNAMVLKKLYIAIRIELQHKTGYAVWKECQFCKLLNLPRRSSTCKVVLSRSVTGSGGSFKLDSESSCCPNDKHTSYRLHTKETKERQRLHKIGDDVCLVCADTSGRTCSHLFSSTSIVLLI